MTVSIIVSVHVNESWVEKWGLLVELAEIRLVNLKGQNFRVKNWIGLKTIRSGEIRKDRVAKHFVNAKRAQQC